MSFAGSTCLGDFRPLADQLVEAGQGGRLEILGLKQDQPGTTPPRWSVGRILARHAEIRQARLPAVGQNRRPEQPQTLPSVDHHAGVAVGKSRCVGHHKGLRPTRAPRSQAGTIDCDVVGRALARSAVPGCDQGPIGAGHDARRVIVVAPQRKDQFRLVLRRVGGTDADRQHGPHDRNRRGRSSASLHCCHRQLAIVVPYAERGSIFWRAGACWRTPDLYSG